MNTLKELDEYFKLLKQLRESTDQEETERLEIELKEIVTPNPSNK